MTKTFELRNNRTGEEIPKYLTKASITKTQTHLVCEFSCENSQFFSAYDNDNANIYEGDVVELFVRTCKDENDYFEIEIAPNNKVFFAHIYNKCTYDENGNKVLDLDFLDPKKIESQVKIDKNNYYVKFSVPFDVIGYSDEIYYNLFRIETDGGNTDANLLSANPTLTNCFHETKAFIKL